VLFVEGESVAVAKERRDGVNFFPGLMLLGMIGERFRPAAATADVGSLAPRLKTHQAAMREPTAAQPDARITASGGASRAVTGEVPEAGGPEEDEE
jgi:hypothetical protein